MQAGNINTNLTVKVNFTLPELSTMNVVTWICHVYDSSRGRYDMILGQYLFNRISIGFKISDHIIEAYDGPFKGSKTPMVDLGTYEFKNLNTEKITPKELFTNAYVEEVYESEHVCTATKQLRVILDAKY